MDSKSSKIFVGGHKEVQMKKLVLFSIIMLSLSVNAYNTAGKFGMGVRFWGSPIITFSNIKYGINDLIEIEPSIGYYSTQSDGEYYNSKDNLLFTVILANFKPIRTERSNLLVKIGGLYAKNSHSYTYSYDDPPYEYSSTTHNRALVFGLGIEHFVNDNFSVNVGALSGYWHRKPEDSEGSYSLMGIGSQIVDFSLVWHLK